MVLDELPDEANQDQVGEIRAKVERYRSLATHSSGYSRGAAGASAWTALGTLSAAFAIRRKR